MPKRNYLTAEHPERGTLFAAFDPAVHHLTGRVEDSRFGARMAPFKSEAEAEQALAAAGANVGGRR